MYRLCTGWITNRLPRQAAWETLGLAQQIQVLIREGGLVVETVLSRPCASSAVPARPSSAEVTVQGPVVRDGCSDSARGG